jgi:nucleotide-binding universal stress UspA family protein
VIVGMDYSPLSEAALHRALRMTEGAPHATIHAVTVARHVGSNVVLPDGSVMSKWAAGEAVRLHLAERVRQWPNTGPANLRVVGHVRGGSPAKALLDMAFRTGAECIVIGSHGGSVSDVMRVGSVAQEVLTEAKLDVHLEAPLTQTPAVTHEFDPLRFAFVFGTGKRRTRDELALRSLGGAP